MANNFGVPQELLDFLKLKVTEKEAEVKKLNEQNSSNLTKMQNMQGKLDTYEQETLVKLEEA